MPSSDWNIQSASDYHFKRCVMGRKLKFTLIPRRCYVTKRIIWLESAYCITAGYQTGFADWLFEHRWYDKNEYIVARLKDLI
jgi:hypothetical protein